jgi:hypothetical protein
VVVAVFVADFTSLIPQAHAAAINGITNTLLTPSTYQYTTFKGVPVYRLDITNSGNTPDTLVSLAPTPVSEVNDTLITLHFYNDANNNGIVDQGDTDLGGSSSFAADNTKKTFTLASPLAIPVGVTHILITADGGPAVGNTQTFHLSFALSTDVVMGTVQITPAPGSDMPNSGIFTISNTAPSLAITNGSSDPIAKTATASQTGVAVKRLTFTAQATSDSIASLAITPAGTENDATQIASTKFYIDSGTTPGAIDGSDILLSTTPTTYTGDNTRTVFTFLSPFLIPGNTAVNILYTYNLGAGVVGGNTLTAQLVATTDAVAGSGIVVSSNSSGISSTITIASPPTLTQPTVVSASTVKASSTAKVIGAFAVTENGGISDHIDQFTIENKTALTATTADIASVAIYSDSGTLGVIDGSDAVACAQATTNTTTNFDAGGSVINFTCTTPIVIGAHATQNYLAVITTTAGATDGRTMSAKVNAHLVTATTWATSDLQTTNPITIDVVAPTTPVANPLAGSYTSAQSVTLSSAGSTSIRVTTDGSSIGSCSSGSLYSGAIAVSSSETIKAVGCDDAGNISSLGTFIYTINSPSPVVSSSAVLHGSRPRVDNTNLSNTAPTTVLLNIPQNISIATFTRTLNTGMANDDIKTLQQYLNNNGFILASSGPGSPGQETTYFGPLTKASLIKFQEAHKDKILTPLGLINGTGYFGSSTKAFINGF